MTEYETIVENIGKRRGRKPLPADERDRRRAIQREENRKRQEARRRAHLVLQHKYADEYSAIFAEEYTALKDGKTSDSVSA